VEEEVEKEVREWIAEFVAGVKAKKSNPPDEIPIP
jgi:hypothetical protein